MKTKFYFSLIVFALLQFSLAAKLTITQKFVDTGGNDITTVDPSTTYRVRFTITNTGSTATNVTLNEAMGDGFNAPGNGVIISGTTSGLTGGWFCTSGCSSNATLPSGDSYNWNIGTLDAGATIVFDIQINTVGTGNPAYMDNTKLTNTASVTDGSSNTVNAAAPSPVHWAGTPTGINDLRSTIHVYSKDKQIFVTGADLNMAKVYNVTGRIVNATKPLQTGIYFVKISNEVHKVSVQ
jgi:hypothetical protein